MYFINILPICRRMVLVMVVVLAKVLKGGDCSIAVVVVSVVAVVVVVSVVSVVVVVAVVSVVSVVVVVSVV